MTAPAELVGSIEALAALIRALETVEGGVFAHCSRVAHNAAAVGAAIGLDEAAVASVYAAGILHDVGKMGVARVVLAKPGRLSAEERAEVERHSTIGAHMILAVSASLATVADGVRAHHERWDGHGYPHALTQDSIPLSGRLIAIADVFDALTSERPYRTRALCDAEALEYLRLEAGKAFDPDLTDAFETLHASGALVVRAS